MTKNFTFSLKNIFDKDILNPLLRLAIPMIFVSLLQSAYQLTDAFWVGRLGGDAVAAVSISFPINFLLLSIGMGLTMASSSLIAQYMGAKNEKMINHVATQSLILIFTVSIILTIVGYILSPQILKLMNIEPQIYKDSLSFLRISVIGILATYIFTLFQAIMRATNEVKTSTYIILSTVILNFILDPLFIYGYKELSGYGVTGAAIATLFTQILAAIISLIILFSGKYNIHIEKKDLNPDYSLIKKIFNLGFPASIEQSSRSIGMLAATFVVSGFGTAVMAGYGVGSNILIFTIIPMVGISIATSILVGQSIGAKNLSKAEHIIKTSSFMSFLGITFFGILVFTFAKQIVGVFLQSDPAATEYAIQNIKHMSPFFGFMGLQITLLGVFRAAGDTKTSMNITLAVQLLIQFPIIYKMSKMFGLTGLWLSFPTVWMVSYLLTLYFYKKGNWKNKNIIDHITSTKREQEKILQETKIESITN